MTSKKNLVPAFFFKYSTCVKIEHQHTLPAFSYYLQIIFNLTAMTSQNSNVLQSLHRFSMALFP